MRHTYNLSDMIDVVEHLSKERSNELGTCMPLLSCVMTAACVMRFVRCVPCVRRAAQKLVINWLMLRGLMEGLKFIKGAPLDLEAEIKKGSLVMLEFWYYSSSLLTLLSTSSFFSLRYRVHTLYSLLIHFIFHIYQYVPHMG